MTLHRGQEQGAWATHVTCAENALLYMMWISPSTFPGSPKTYVQAFEPRGIIWTSIGLPFDISFVAVAFYLVMFPRGEVLNSLVYE